MGSWLRVRAMLAGAAIASTCSIHTPAARSSQQAEEQGPGEEAQGETEEPAGAAPVPANARATVQAAPRPVPADFEGRAAWLKGRIDEIVALRAKVLGDSRIGIAVYDLAAEKMIYEKDAEG